MSGAILPSEDRAHFLRLMRHHTPSPVHRRMNALLLLDDGRAAERVPAVMFIDAETVRELRRLYQVAGVAGIEQLKFEGSDPALSAAGSGTERRAVRVSKGNMCLRAAQLRRELYSARDGQAAEAAGLCLQEAEVRAGKSQRQNGHSWRRPLVP